MALWVSWQAFWVRRTVFYAITKPLLEMPLWKTGVSRANGGIVVHMELPLDNFSHVMEQPVRLIAATSLI